MKMCAVPGCDEPDAGMEASPMEAYDRVIPLCVRHGDDLICRAPTDPIRRRVAKQLNLPPMKKPKKSRA